MDIKIKRVSERTYLVNNEYLVTLQHDFTNLGTAIFRESVPEDARKIERKVVQAHMWDNLPIEEL